MEESDESKPSKGAICDVILSRDDNTHVFSQDLVEYDLKDNKTSLTQGILIYNQARSEESLKELKKKKYGGDRLKCIVELSEILDLNELSSEKVFTAWLINEYRDTPDSLKSCLSDERCRYHLLRRLVSFYFTDRIYCHLTLKQMISHAHNDQHPFKGVYSKFLDDVESNGSGQFYKLLSAEYESLYNKEPLELYDSPLRHLLTEEHQSSWCYQLLKEQVIVLETLLIYLYYTPTCKQTYLHDLISKFKTRALTGHPHTAIKHLITDLHKPLLVRLQQLQVLIVLVCMRLDNPTPEDSPQSDQRSLMQKLDIMFVTRLGEFPSHGPLILAWAVARCGKISQDGISQLGDKALKLDVFSYIRTLLHNLEPQEISNQLAVITVYHLVSRVLALFDDSAMDDEETITDVICQLLKFQTVSDMVIQAGEGDAIYRYINSSLSSFPLHFHSPLLMLTAMASSSRAAAIHVVQRLLVVPTFTEYLDANSQANLQFLTDTQLELTEDRPLFGGSVLPAGTIGLTADADGPPTVQWHYSFNAWDLLSHELAAVCYQPHLVADVNVQRRLMTNTRLMAATFKHAAISGEPAEMIHDSLYRIIHGLSSLESPPTDVLASCLDLSASITNFTPSRVIENLAVVFLPFFTNVADTLKRPWEAQIERSLLGHVLYSSECLQSRYSVLISSLKLVCSALTAPQDNAPLVRQQLAPVLLFVLRDVLPAYNSWRYTDAHERDTIGELCMEMVHSALYNKNSKDDGLAQACMQNLLHTTSGQTIFGMISMGSDLLDLAILEQASVEVSSCLTRHGRPSTVYRLGLCLSLLKGLLEVAQASKEETVLEASLSSKATQSQVHLTRVMASYTYHRHSNRLAVLSTQLLNVIAQEPGMSLLSSFGEDAYAIRSGLLRRLALRSENPRFKVVLVELLTTCVENQPGLLELFLSTNPDTEEPLLTITQKLIESDKQLTHICPGELLLACLNFVLALWSAGRERVTQKLALSKSFWQTVVTPLTKHLGDMHSGSMSHPQKANIFCNVLQLLTYQLYQREEKKEFSTVINSISQEQWQGISKFVHTELKFIIATKLNPGDDTLRHTAAIHLLDSYRMFLSTTHLAGQTLFEPSTCVSVMEDVLSTLTELVAGEVTQTYQRLASMLSSMLFELITKWSSHLTNWQHSYKELARILHTATNAGSDMTLLPSSLIGIVASLQLLNSRKLRRPKLHDSTVESMESVLSCVCNLLPATCSQLSSRENLSFTDTSSLEKLRVVLLSALFEVIKKLPESVWIPRLHESYVIPALLGSLAHNIKVQKDLQYVESCIALLTDLSSKLSTSKLISQTLAEHLTLTVSALYEGSSDLEVAAADVPKALSSWQHVMGQVVDVYAFLLSTQTHGFVSHAATFIAVHTDRIFLLMERLSTDLNDGSIAELRAFVHLLASLSKHEHQWTTEAGCAKVKKLLVGVCYLSQDCVALLHRPRAIQHILLKQRAGRQKATKLDDVDISSTRQGFLLSQGSEVHA
ncbi:nucleoporin NUP188-like [Watersipora subatra]|uniref:nucleoporin NUP188-like n=1 Tax=Watersipora subatra TaxID=2589382 RepID=UPI00355BA137